MRDRLLGTARRAISTSSSTATRARLRARSRARRGRAACFALSEEFGAWRVVARDSLLAGRCRAAARQLARGRPRAARLHRQRDRRAARRRRADRPARRARPICARGGCGWPAPAPSRRTRCACCASCASPSSSASSPSRRRRAPRAAHAPALARRVAPSACSSSCAGSSPRRGSAAGLELLERARRQRRRAARARRAARRRAEPLSPPRRLRPHARGARPNGRADERHAGDQRRRRRARRVHRRAPRGGRALLAEPLADELTRGEALRWGALLHDAAKPLTRDVQRRDGRVTFIGHDVRGAQLAREVLGAPAHQRAPARARRGARAPPPAPRLPRARAAAAGAPDASSPTCARPSRSRST